ncbi:MAG: undecaprenyl-diphosphate phosphatase [Ruminococcaceae bacterium]|nr:undecaprenyl-diphosphate phosphatase [Oscillospiraceae bacterium]
MIEILKSLLLGIVEGITEWLPISSTGHMILLNRFINNTGFTNSDLYIYVIQLGAILAVVTMYFKKLNPFAPSKSKLEKSETWHMWFKVIVACIPAAVIGLIFNDYMKDNEFLVASTLLIYGIAFIVVENRKKTPVVTTLNTLTYKTALIIGAFQVLSIVPGTSRSGATILGAIIIGCSRELAAEFSFFLAIPVMFGVSFLKIITNLDLFSTENLLVLITGMLVAYVVSLISMKFLVEYVKKHDFKFFGYYRIILAVIVLAYFGISAIVA